MSAFGVYVHIPFCASRCDYCAFATWTDRDHLMAAYVDACAREVRAAALPPATSVYIGGGTPSRLPPAELAGVVSAIDLVEDGAEITAECNPEDASAERFACWRAAGVTRVSFGVQSMVPHVLAALGRRHAPSAVSRAAALARDAGFDSWSLDLIYGAAGESLGDWRRTLDDALALTPPHVSAYALTVEPGTPLAGDAARHPDDDDQAEKYAIADDLLTASGLGWYEVSNWARPGNECRHNQLYWQQGNYRGIGCAAHSHVDGHRWWNVRTPERYIAAIDAGGTPVAGEEMLDEPTRRRERVELGLRTRDGVAAAAVDHAGIEHLVEIDAGRAVLTRAGRLLANEVAHRLRV
jgi:putative oxygen-independent coproporphyrinogen III oxidase